MILRDERRYVPALTGLRAWAFFLVLLDHWIPGMHDYGMIGNAGVSLFFVLSGFLISRILLAEKIKAGQDGAVSSLKSYLLPFYQRRARRIFPIYYLTLVGLWLVGDPVIKKHGLWFYSYTANVFLVNHHPGNLEHLWSLSAEEQLYVLMPFTLWFCPLRHIPRISVLLISLSLVYRASSYYLFTENDWWSASYSLLPGCLDGYGIGLVVAYYFLIKPQQAEKFFQSSRLLNILITAWPLVVLSGLLWAITGRGPFYSPGMAVGVRFTVSLVGGYLIGYCQGSINRFWQGLLLNPVVQYLGQISYGLYLYHNLIYNIHLRPDYPTRRLYQWVEANVHSLLRADVTNPGWASPLLELSFYGILTIGVASLSWFLIEKPLLQPVTRPALLPEKAIR